MPTATMTRKETESSVKSDQEIIDLLFQQVDKPTNILKIKVINVFENAYRINIWSENFDKIFQINKVKISHSYFCRLRENNLFINN